MYHKRGLQAIKAKHGGKFPLHEKAAAALLPEENPPKFYPADDVRKPLSNNRKPKTTKLSQHYSRDSFDNIGREI
ncbi:60S ribosomal protein L6 [Orobanche minor]